MTSATTPQAKPAEERRNPLRAGIRAALARMLARLPVTLKGTTLQRIGRMICRASPEVLVTSNLGIAPGLRFQVPLSRSDLAFSRPDRNLAERATLDLAAQLAQRCAGFIDVGANYGLYSAQLACHAAIPILAIEADPGLCRRLTENARASLPRVTVIHAAAAAEHGAIRVFHQNLDDDLSGSLTQAFSDRHRTRPVEVPTIALAQLIAERGLERLLVKVDVEGAGAEAWQGLAAAADRVEFLLMEIIGPEAAIELPRLICEQSDFRSYYICDYHLMRTDFADYEYVEPFWNWLFTRHDPAALRQMLGPQFTVSGE